MFNTIAESNADQDLGSGGVVVLPDMIDSGGITRHLAVGGGKDGHLYIANRDHMGKFNASSNANIDQDFPGASARGLSPTPAYFNGTPYVGRTGAHLKAFAISNGSL